ncbi:MAG TPA: PIN domain-containing protein [Verrucomicrobiae bacterium]|nr:PIN domain-containing protein [Verrucomicrobiae bacterium]
MLDTNALIWLQARHRRNRSLSRWMGHLYISPANLLEIQFLLEAQRIRLRTGTRIDNLVDDQRWVLDDPPAAAWFSVARELIWTRDPFDRLLAATRGTEAGSWLPETGTL